MESEALNAAAIFGFLVGGGAGWGLAKRLSLMGVERLLVTGACALLGTAIAVLAVIRAS